jgi:hypothetical protein
VVLDPVVTQAELQLVSYRLERVSQLRGAPAFELGKALRELLERQVAKQQERLPRKLNEQIEKNRDKLRFSVSELFESEWKGLAGSYLGIAPLDTETAPDEPAVASPRVP